ncbi:polysaccharide biosynthesis tyrosine autokinase [uncultured Thiodictyon sp.]|uniref:GumC family protein n=1 Tax=uncultured Thiodictyon sp. TaxID=1846217 RepID=UPI0025F446EE|nr:polysaccharide biosynthesis tyrosine autokinase [uncultured Thiodictyon sp.]
MSQELRIRDRVRAQGAGATPDPGEAAWDLREPVEPGFNLAPLPAAPETPDEPPSPFAGFPGMGGEEEAPPPKGPGLDLQRLIRGILKRLWLAVGIALAIAGLFLAGALSLKSKWEAAASVMLHSRQDQFSLGGAKPFELQTYNLKTLLDTIKLPDSLLEVAKALQLDASLRTLGTAINVKSGKDSSLFQITAMWNDPGIAAQIANAVAEGLVERSRKFRSDEAADAYANYSKQLAAAREELDRVTAQMRTFKTAHQVSDINAETQVLLGSLSLLEADLNTKTAELQAYKRTLIEVEQAVKGEPAMVVTSSVYRNPLKTRLSDYEWQLQEARSRYTEQNPKVIKLQTRVDVLKQMITESKDEGAPENLYSANAKLTDLQTRQSTLTSDIRVREAQIVALTETVAQNRAKLTALTAAEKEFQLLKARMAAAENLVAGLVGRMDEAEVMMRRNEAGFDLIQLATAPTEPAPSKKKIIAIAGVVLGGGIGLGVALLLELLDPLLRTRRDALGIIPGLELAWEFQQVPAGETALIDPRRPADPVADLFRRLINELDTQLEPAHWRCLGITSAEPAAGRTLVATNLAQALALKELPTILVDADLRRLAGVHPAPLLGLPADQSGLLQALRDEAPLTSLLAVTATPDLALLAAGSPPGDLALDAPTTGDGADADPEQDEGPPAIQRPDPNLIDLGTRQFRTILDTLRESGRNLVYDLPPSSAQETVLEAAASLGNLLLVARSGQTTRQQLRETAELLEERGAKVQGILVTDVPYELLEGPPLFQPAPKASARRRWLHRWRPRTPASEP